MSEQAQSKVGGLRVVASYEESFAKLVGPVAEGEER